MNNPYINYLDLGASPDRENNISATFMLKSEGQPFERTAGGVAAESSVGTWTEIKLNEKILWETLHGRVTEMDESRGLVKVSYPLDLFEKGSIPQLLSSIAGNVFGLSEVAVLRLMDIEFPQKYVLSFPGPGLGIEGIRNLTGLRDRPFLGSIIKPKLGLSTNDHAQAAMAVYDGGLDLVKDDENLTSQDFNPFEDRVKTMTRLMKEKGYLGMKGAEKIYCFNISAPYEIMQRRAALVTEEGGNCLMVDILTAGFASLQGIRNSNTGKMIHAHRAMHAAFTRGKDYGMSMLVIAKLTRLAGADSLHTGTVVGKMEGGKDEVCAINEFLRSDWFGLKPVLPVASGGLHPGLMTDLYGILGKDMLFNFGGGIHGHPDGSLEGAKAVNAALQAAVEGISLEEFARTNNSLSRALENWKME